MWTQTPEIIECQTYVWPDVLDHRPLRMATSLGFVRDRRTKFLEGRETAHSPVLDAHNQFEMSGDAEILQSRQASELLRPCPATV